MTTQPDDGIIIRNAAISDAALFRELRLEALENHPTAFGSDYTENALKPAKFWEERVSFNEDEQAIFFAEKHGQLIGMAGIFRSLSKKNLHSANIFGVYVRPNWRGHRISQTLVKACLDWAKLKSIIIVKLAVVTSNRSAIHTYQQCGFVMYGKEPKALCVDGIYYDEYLMSVGIL